MASPCYSSSLCSLLVVDHADHLVAQVVPHPLLIWPLTLQSMPLELDIPSQFLVGGNAGLLQLQLLSVNDI